MYVCGGMSNYYTFFFVLFLWISIGFIYVCSFACICMCFWFFLIIVENAVICPFLMQICDKVFTCSILFLFCVHSIWIWYYTVFENSHRFYFSNMYLCTSDMNCIAFCALICKLQKSCDFTVCCFLPLLKQICNLFFYFAIITHIFFALNFYFIYYFVFL